MDDHDRTASLMTPSKLAQVKPQGPSPAAAWLDQMAADAGHAHVRRLGELRQELLAHVLRADCAPVAAELTRLGEALPGLDFGLLQPQGWWARATGKNRTAGAEFAAGFGRIEQAGQALPARIEALQKRQAQGPAGDRTVLEFEVEYRAIDKIIEQGTRWLHDMRNQLKARQAAGPDEAAQQQIRNDAARCEILVERLKALRTVSSAAQQSHQHAVDAVARGATLAQMLQQMLASDLKVWRQRLAALAGTAAQRGTAGEGLEGAEEAHRDLGLCIRQAAADCAQLKVQEKVLSDSLDVLDARLRALTPP